MIFGIFREPFGDALRASDLCGRTDRSLNEDDIQIFFIAADFFQISVEPRDRIISFFDEISADPADVQAVVGNFH